MTNGISPSPPRRFWPRESTRGTSRTTVPSWRFGAALAAVIALALAQFVKDGVLIGGPIMALVWWAAHKLTWDCTLLEDAPDVSGQGLLQQMGLDATARPATASAPGTKSPVADPEA